MSDITVIQAGTEAFRQLKHALEVAEANDGSLSISTQHGVQIKIGGGMWSPPLTARRPYTGPDYDPAR